MASRRRSGQRKAQRRLGAAIQIVGVGAGLSVLPWVMSSSPLGPALRPLSYVGGCLLAVGIALLWWQLRRGRDAGEVPLPTIDQQAGTPSRTTASESTRPTAWSAAVFDQIEWRRFEALVEALFAQAGFETRSQSHGADGGVDIWLHSRHQPGAPVSIVQCKHWAGKQVGVDKVRELRGVMAAKSVKRGQFATTSTFTAQAIEFARDNAIALLDASAILDLIAKRSPAEQAALLAIATEGDYGRPTCASCGTKMIERTPSKGGKPFWGCANYPKCRSTLPMKVRSSA